MCRPKGRERTCPLRDHTATDRRGGGGVRTLGFQVSRPGAAVVNKISRMRLRLFCMLAAVTPRDCRLEEAIDSRLGNTLPAWAGRVSTTCKGGMEVKNDDTRIKASRLSATNVTSTSPQNSGILWNMEEGGDSNNNERMGCGKVGPQCLREAGFWICFSVFFFVYFIRF
jgi:hypothetical protein